MCQWYAINFQGCIRRTDTVLFYYPLWVLSLSDYFFVSFVNVSSWTHNVYSLKASPVIFKTKFWIKIPFPPCDALTIIDLKGNLSACGYGDCLNSYCFTLLGSIFGIFRKYFCNIYCNMTYHFALDMGSGKMVRLRTGCHFAPIRGN